MGIEDLMKEITDENESIINSKTLLGEPFTWAGKTVMPVIKMSAGYGSAGGERKKETSHGFAGGGYTGVNMEPIAFVVIADEDVRLLSITGKHRYSSVIDLIPEVASKLPEAMERAREASNEIAEKVKIKSEEAGKKIKEKREAMKEEAELEEAEELTEVAEEETEGNWEGSSK
ncbi:spore germination protein GerW family protein [Methanolobus sp. ZRKC2]|uniref:GerW family sporulation protein n=1 Tax=Methanolobus sp. ZRKC2 TaxID=3125783 RepID=UPI003252F562